MEYVRGRQDSNLSSKSLRSGFTTGACAAAAAKAAACCLVYNNKDVTDVEISLLDGSRVVLPVEWLERGADCARAAVKKDAGDDPDVTDGVLVIASVRPLESPGIRFRAGEGVGTITKKGLALPPGEPAINPGPRAMIRMAVGEVSVQGFEVTVSIPGGEQLAKRTFNPRLGIVGGLSVLGTTGRVRPFSCRALRCTIRCAFSVARASGVKAPVLVPGRIGERSARAMLHLAEEQVIEVGNEWDFALQCVADYGWQHILLWGHPGKLAKLAVGQWDTHSSRSISAVDVLRRLFPGYVRDSIVTAEAFFNSLPQHQSCLFGDATARAIAKTVEDRLAGQVAVTVGLVNLRGELLGVFGELGPWEA